MGLRIKDLQHQFDEIVDVSFEELSERYQVFSQEQIEQFIDTQDAELTIALEEYSVQVNKLIQLYDLKELIETNGTCIVAMEALYEVATINKPTMMLEMFTEQYSQVNVDYALETISDAVSEIIKFLSKHLTKLIMIVIALISGMVLYFKGKHESGSESQGNSHEQTVTWKPSADVKPENYIRESIEISKKQVKDAHDQIAEIEKMQHENNEQLDKISSTIQSSLVKQLVLEVRPDILYSIERETIQHYNLFIRASEDKESFVAKAASIIDEIRKKLMEVGNHAISQVHEHKLLDAEHHQKLKTELQHWLEHSVIPDILARFKREAAKKTHFNTELDFLIATKVSGYTLPDILKTVDAIYSVLKEQTDLMGDILYSVGKMVTFILNNIPITDEIDKIYKIVTRNNYGAVPYTLGPVFQDIAKHGGHKPLSSDNFSRASKDVHVKYGDKVEFWNPATFVLDNASAESADYGYAFWGHGENIKSLKPFEFSNHNLPTSQEIEHAIQYFGRLSIQSNSLRQSVLSGEQILSELYIKHSKENIEEHRSAQQIEQMHTTYCWPPQSLQKGTGHKYQISYYDMAKKLPIIENGYLMRHHVTIVTILCNMLRDVSQVGRRIKKIHDVFS